MDYSEANHREVNYSGIITTDAPPMPEPSPSNPMENIMLGELSEPKEIFNFDMIWEPFENEKQKQFEKMEKGGQLTEDDCNSINKEMEEAINKTFDNVKEQVFSKSNITPGDNTEDVKKKLSYLKRLVAWLKDLFSWLFMQIKNIFSKIKECIEFCWKEVKELFSSIFGFSK